MEDSMKVLFATDGTKYSECAIKTISKFNFSAGDEIKIVSVLDMALPLAVDIYAGYLPSSIEIEQGSKENAERILQNTQKQILDLFPEKNILVSTEILIGTPETKIVETAALMKADLVIVGSHGYNLWERLLLGSVSDSVVHKAPCSVMVVKTSVE
jgi:nucleotide-binding universal stress UspA family protein